MAMTKLKERCELVRLGQTSASRQMRPEETANLVIRVDIRIYSLVILTGAAKSSFLS